MSFEVMFFKDDREMFYLGNPWDAIDHFVCRCARMFKPSSDREFFVPKEVRNSDDPHIRDRFRTYDTTSEVEFS